MDSASSSSSAKKDPLKARAPNFTPRDETILVTLVRKYRDILQSKKTDTNSNNSKIATWQRLELEFNAVCGGTYRNSRVLKNKYENLKKRNRKQLREDLSDVKDISSTDISLTESEYQMPENIQDIFEMDKKLSQLRQEREELTTAQVRCLFEEHQLKLQHMQEKHEKMLLIQERESRLRMKLLEEEHKVKMDILRLKKSKGDIPLNGRFSTE